MSRSDGAGNLTVEIVACPLCGEPRSTSLFNQRDLALGLPGRYTVARCDGCGADIAAILAHPAGHGDPQAQDGKRHTDLCETHG